MSVLLADSGITSLLGSASAGSSARRASSPSTQDFLAQTAMIVAEGPNAPSRSLVIAPPTRLGPVACRGRGAAVDH